VEESIVIGGQAFCNCPSLTEVELSRVEEIGSGAFRYCGSLEKVIFDEGLLSVGSSAFEGTAYAVIDLPDSLRKIDSYAFGGYGEDIRPGSSGNIHIGPNVSRIGEGAFTAIGATAFDVDPGNTHFASAGGLLISKGGDRVISCPSGIKGRVDIPDGTVYIDDWAFSFAHDVTEVHIPDSVVAIGTVNFDRVDSGKTDASGNSIREYTVTFYCSEGSFAHEFALERGIPFKLE